METRIFGKKLLGRNGILYPMLVIAAIAVIIFSAFGVATMTGLLPRAESTNDTHAMTKNRVASSADKTCNNCGVIESINTVEVKGQGSGLGAVAGGVTGALIGNQIGRGNGNTVATIAGMAGGAYAGNEIEKNMKKSSRYQVRVRMNDGTLRTTYSSSAPAFAIGDRVRIMNGQVVAAG